jgi:hypothetical protein
MFFFRECVANHVFSTVFAVNYVFFPERLGAHSGKIKMVGSTLYGKNMIGSKFWEKT